MPFSPYQLTELGKQDIHTLIPIPDANNTTHDYKYRCIIIHDFMCKKLTHKPITTKFTAFASVPELVLFVYKH